MDLLNVSLTMKQSNLGTAHKVRSIIDEEQLSSDPCSERFLGHESPRFDILSGASVA